MKKLTSLDFIVSHNGVNKDGIEPISAMLKTLSPTLKFFGLSLFANQIGEEGASVLGPAVA